MRTWIWLAVALLVSAAPVAAQTKWDMPTPYADGVYHTKNVREFAEDVAKASGGKLQITVHSNASLIKMPEIKRAVQTGQVQIGEILVSVLSNEDPIFGFESIPFLAVNFDDAKKLYGVAKPYVASRLEKQGLMLLYMVNWPPQGIYTKKPLKSAADIKGTKFRTYSPSTSRLAELLGAVPTTVQVPELPQAFRAGLVDMMITSASTGTSTQSWDFVNYYYDTQAFLPMNLVFVNKDAFDKLDAATKKAVLDAAAKAEARGREMAIAENDSKKKELASHGMKVEAPPAAFSADMKKVGATMAEEWAGKAGPDGKAILAGFNK